jgi:hypothetical protein
MARMKEICTYCINRTSEVCHQCRTEGRFRFLEPDNLDPWEQAPELPSMRKLVDLTPYERLAVLYLSVALEQRQRTKKGEI